MTILSSLLYSEIYAFALALMVMVLLWNHKAQDKSLSGLWFTRSLYSFTLCYLFDFLWGLADAGVIFPKEGPVYFWSYFWKVLYFIALFSSFVIWSVYTETEAGSDMYQNADRVRMLLVPILLEIALAILTPWTGILFTIDEHGKLYIGYMFDLMVGLALIYPVAAGIRMLLKRQYESNQQRSSQMLTIGTFPFFLLAAWVLTFFMHNSSVFCIAATVAILNIDLGNSTEQISLDKLTQINNRQNLLGYCAHEIKYHEQNLYLLMMDVDYFKKVNDNFGHQEGDAALVRVANALKTACGHFNFKKRPYLARYGGDEFIIVVEASSNEAIDDLCSEIRKQLHYYNSWAEADYDLTMSIGVAHWEEGLDTKTFIETADKQLYEAKKSRHPFTMHERKVPRGVNIEA